MWKVGWIMEGVMIECDGSINQRLYMNLFTILYENNYII